MSLKRARYLRDSFLHFSRIYADYIVLRKQLMLLKMERECRRKLALEMGKVLAQHRICVEHAMKELDAKT